MADRIYATTISDKPMFYCPSVNDSTNYKYYGLRSDINKILNVFNVSFIDSAINGNWRDMNLYNNQAVLSSLAFPSQPVNIIPDVRGLGLKDAVYLLENSGLNVSAAGKGKVMYQSIASGSNFNKGQTINIQLN